MKRCQGMGPGEEGVGKRVIQVEEAAGKGTEYNRGVKIVTSVEEIGVTPGFWHNWKRYYNEAEVEGWLEDIDEESRWLLDDIDGDGVDVDDMKAIFKAGIGKRSRFLRYYLATRLNAQTEPPRLYLKNTHDVTGISGYEYLGLAPPADAKLSDIFTAIEQQHGPWPNEHKDNQIKRHR